MNRLRPDYIILFFLGIGVFAIWETILPFQASHCSQNQQQSGQHAPQNKSAAAQQQSKHGSEKQGHEAIIEPFVCSVFGLPTAIRVFMNRNEGFVVGGFTLCLVFVTGWLVWATLSLRESTDRLWEAGERQLALAYPPRIFVKNVSIWPKGGTRNQPISFVPGEEFDGEAYIVFYGRETLIITTAECMPYWGHLPMIPPYLTTTDAGGQGTWPKLRDERGNELDLTDVRHGIAKWNFSVPADTTGSMQLYVMGRLVYKDRFETYRPTLFCRQFDASECRFVPEKDNPDYESFE